jgi:hypothetical protein
VVQATTSLIQVSASIRRVRFNGGMHTARHEKTRLSPAAGLLDVRHLPAPEPMWRILDALSGMAPGDVLRARTPRLPLPLIELLEREGHRVDVVVAEAGDAWMTIRVDGDCARA